MAHEVSGKSARLLYTGRVHVPDVYRVIVDGDTGQRTVTWEQGEWECDCPGYLYRRTCSHVDAVRAVTQPPAA